MISPGRLFLLILATGALAFGWSFRSATAPTEAATHARGAELEWLRQEYALSPAQFRQVEALYREFTPRCQGLYERLAQAEDRTEKLIAENHQITPDVIAALSECTHLQEEGRRASLAHVYAVAEQMTAPQGSRYLAAMKTRILEPGAAVRTAQVHWPR